MSFNSHDQELYKSMFVKKLMENYDPYIQAVAKNTPNLSDERAAKLAIMLSNTEQAMLKAGRKLNESTQVSDAGGEFKKHAMALISATFPNLIAEELVSVQPLQYKINL